MSTFNKYKSGLGNSAAYQVSGKPFFSSSAVPASGSQPTYWKIEFPAVTKEITITNNSSQTNEEVRIAMSSNGLNNTVKNYFLKHSSKDGVGAVTFNIKATEIYIMSDGSHTPEVSIYASLTGISTEDIVNNWSGSSGVS